MKKMHDFIIMYINKILETAYGSSYMGMIKYILMLLFME